MSEVDSSVQNINFSETQTSIHSHQEENLKAVIEEDLNSLLECLQPE